MRALADPATFKSAIVGALLTTLASLPRVTQWPTRVLPLWYVAATLLLTSFVMWSFVFGWHQARTGRAPLRWVRAPKLWGVATLGALALAMLQRQFLDPQLRPFNLEEYPASLGAWLAATLFLLGFTQLFGLFAPFAFWVRLTRRLWMAAVLTVALGLFVFSYKLGASRTPPPPTLLWELAGVRLLGGSLAVWCYVEGGLPLAWWVALLVQSRHLWSLADGLSP
jgi:hypothetical protein